MAENESGSEHQVKKTVVYEQSSTDTSRSIIPAVVIVGVIVLALLIFIFMRIG